MELVVSAGTEEIADGIVVGVEEEGGKVIVVTRGTLEVLEIAGAAYGRALLLEMCGAGSAAGEPREPVRAA